MFEIETEIHLTFILQLISIALLLYGFIKLNRKVNTIMATQPTPQWQADLLAEVQNQGTVDQSIETLVTGLLSQVQALIAQGQDPTAFIETQIAQIKANNKAVSDMVTANTPAAPTT